VKILKLNKTLILDYNKWVFGGVVDRGTSKMQNQEGFQCCLGQFSCQAGIDELSLLNCNYPSTVAIRNGIVVDELVDLETSSYDSSHTIFSQSQLSNYAANINDEKRYSIPMKMFLLYKLFQKNGFEIRFDNFSENDIMDFNTLLAA
jgi:hypothetical protein